MLAPDEVVRRLHTAMFTGGSIAFDSVPDLLRKIIEREIWAQCRDRNKTLFKSFEAFATAKKPEGLESTIDDLLAFCRKKPEVQALIKGVADALPANGEIGRGRPDSSNNVSVTQHGNSATYTLKRLKRDRPELAAKVASGKMSANAAAIEAGFRKRTFAVPDDLEGAVAAILKRFGDGAVMGALIARNRRKRAA